MAGGGRATCALETRGVEKRRLIRRLLSSVLVLYQSSAFDNLGGGLLLRMAHSWPNGSLIWESRAGVHLRPTTVAELEYPILRFCNLEGDKVGVSGGRATCLAGSTIEYETFLKKIEYETVTNCRQVRRGVDWSISFSRLEQLNTERNFCLAAASPQSGESQTTPPAAYTPERRNKR